MRSRTSCSLNCAKPGRAWTRLDTDLVTALTGTLSLFNVTRIQQKQKDRIMKQLPRYFGLALAALVTHSVSAAAVNWTADMKEGKVAFKSLGPLAFGPDGILFAADTKAAAIFAINTADTKPAAKELLQVKGVN